MKKFNTQPALEKGVEKIKHMTMAKALADNASGYKPHAQVFGEHAAGFTKHDDHVEAMCGGGMAKGKK